MFCKPKRKQTEDIKNPVFSLKIPAGLLAAGIFPVFAVEKPVENVENFFGEKAEKRRYYYIYVNRYSVALTGELTAKEKFDTIEKIRNHG
ncbi:MAG: hypothetical protein J6B67_00840 [Oscillospiraceae bacterium]|nr:hypothetical protein [Oscillospiraceae bacterium]